MQFTAPTTTGLTSYWSFDEANGDGTDSAGANTAQCRPGGQCPTRVQGVAGNAASFNGSNQCFTVPTMMTWAAPAFTVGAWVSSPTLSDSLFVHESAAGCPSPEPLRLSGGVVGLVQLSTSDSTHNNAFTPSPMIAANEWHHVAVTWDGTTQAVYVDGVCSCSIAPSLQPLDNPQELTIGCYPDASTSYTGSIDELRVYDRVLSPSEIGDLYSFFSQKTVTAVACSQQCNNVAPN